MKLPCRSSLFETLKILPLSYIIIGDKGFNQHKRKDVHRPPYRLIAEKTQLKD